MKLKPCCNKYFENGDHDKRGTCGTVFFPELSAPPVKRVGMRLSRDEELLKRRCDAIVFDPKLFKALDDCVARLNALHFLLNDASTGLSVN